jgi:hypothetical protein
MTAPPEEPTSGAASGGETHTLSRTLRHQAKPFSLPPSQKRLASSTVAQHHRVGELISHVSERRGVTLEILKPPVGSDGSGGLAKGC